MSRVLPILVLMLVPAAPAAADDAKRTDVEQIIAALHNGRMDYEKDLRTTPFAEVIEDLAKQHDVKFVVNKQVIGEMSPQLDSAKAERFTATSTKDMSLHAFLRAYLPTVPIDDLTYAVRADHIEITTKTALREEVGLHDESETSDASSPSRMNLPIVCAAAKDKSLSAVLDDLRRVYGVNIVVETALKPQLKTAITEQLLNVPVDTALELLAGQADLGVVRKGNTFRIMSNAKGGAVLAFPDLRSVSEHGKK